ncbi:branched-chain amino acid transport system permease protein [Diaminobutyricimonas aerilata]|uniref:Branched-chain amino acid transport system permease protein n=1 Tax=Diaminobutyricimonas aerilata TaxID=1162967 RepID=A0A2M9CMR8_9MICO|nr:branched-chain amino acid ABC transporter permease [Diaminobutyricimonas aerilata]PJJ73168.1 branched-chain amino acid transport system permease protein [Diaminobutyricimonas aerilata]
MDWGSILGNAAGEIISPTTAAYALAAIGVGVHFGYAGLLNFGQAGFMAVGAYAFAITTLELGFSVPLAILASVIASIIFAFILGIPTLRLRADYLAIVTIAAAEIVRYLVSTVGLTDLTGGSQGLSGYAREFQALNPFGEGTFGIGPWVYSGEQWWVRVFGWGLVAIASVLVWLLMRSPWGRVVKGIREDEDAVRSLGKNVYSYKMQALVLGGVLGALAGVVFILPRAVQPGNYGTALTFFIWTALLLGGAATVWGPIVGSMIFWVVLSLTNGIINGLRSADVLSFISSTQAGQIRFILVGVALMLLVIFRPQGIFGNKKELSFNV